MRPRPHNGHRNGGQRFVVSTRHPSLPSLKKGEEMPAHGRIKFYDAKRGFGFIERDGEGDVFLHSKVISQYVGFAVRLEPGLPVQFAFEEVPGRRPEATAVRIVT